MAGDAETGVMIMRMEEGLDTGPVLMAERTPIGRKTYGELHDELSRLGADLMVRTLAALERGSIARDSRKPTDGVTYAKKIEKDEARIDWTKSAREIDCLIRGLSPFARRMVRGERRAPEDPLCRTRRRAAARPARCSTMRLTVACGEGALRLTRLQRAGKVGDGRRTNCCAASRCRAARCSSDAALSPHPRI